MNSDKRKKLYPISGITQEKWDSLSIGHEITFEIFKDNNAERLAKNFEIIELAKEHYKLPKDTRGIIDFNLDEVDNYALRLNKMAYFDVEGKKDKKEKFVFYKTDKKSAKEIINIKPNFSKIKFKQISQRQKALLEDSGLEVKSFEFKTDWRLIVGLGHESVYETSITLHHIYGFPVIPGSAIKGMTRNYVITTIFKGQEEEALEDDGFVAVFGKQEQQGGVLFFDAFPALKQSSQNHQIEAPDLNIEVDIMNPHYGPYYSDDKNEEMPADYHNPRPVNFLTVKNAKFNIYLAIKKENNVEIQQTSKDNNVPKSKSKFEGNKPLDIAVKYVKEAFQKQGIGSKTAVGYGYGNCK